MFLFFFRPVERPSAILDVDPGASLLVVPDPFHSLEMSDAPGIGRSFEQLCFSLMTFDFLKQIQGCLRHEYLKSPCVGRPKISIVR